jgi:hypothetical protein
VIAIDPRHFCDSVQALDADSDRTAVFDLRCGVPALCHAIYHQVETTALARCQAGVHPMVVEPLLLQLFRAFALG